MHADFCMISDRPMVLTVDENNQPHGENGPFCQWRDGTALYSWHGTRIPAKWVLERKTIDPAEILRCEDVEQRAAGYQCLGWDRFPHTVIDVDPDPSHGSLIEVAIEGLPEPGRYLKAECPRNGVICEGVPNNIKTVLEAQAWRVGLLPKEFNYPPVRT